MAFRITFGVSDAYTAHLQCTVFRGFDAYKGLVNTGLMDALGSYIQLL